MGVPGTWRNCPERARIEGTALGTGVFLSLGALINGIILIVDSLFVLYEAIPRLFIHNIRMHRGWYGWQS